MRSLRRLAFVTLLSLLVVAALGPRPEVRAEGSPSSARVLLVFGVGGVLTADGTLWSFLPDRDRWVTIDEAFSLQSRETHILPLPVPAESIAQITSFGFFLTKTGECWLYEIERDRWKKLPAPGR